jgi:putative oxidoreductase
MTKLLNRIIGCFEAIPYAVLGLLARFSIGLVFFLSGRTKVEGWNIFDITDSAAFLFEHEYKLPLVPPVLAAHLAAIAEHVLPVLLWLGLGTRFAALGLLVMTAVIQIFVYPGAYALHALWATALLLLVKFGPGEVSLDHVLGKK